MKKYYHVFFIVLFWGCGSSKHYITEDPKPIVQQPSTLTDEQLIQSKYAQLLDIEPDKLKNIKLYTFIDEWLGIPYVLGGESKSGIDCSSFAQHLYDNVFNYLIERTAHKQYKANSTYKFIGQEYLKEGDLLFFKSQNTKDKTITHVGIYLTNNRFISATSYRGPSRKNGVKISDLTLPYWQGKFVAAGRKKLEKYKE